MGDQEVWIYLTDSFKISFCILYKIIKWWRGIIDSLLTTIVIFKHFKLLGSCRQMTIMRIFIIDPLLESSVVLVSFLPLNWIQNFRSLSIGRKDFLLYILRSSLLATDPRGRDTNPFDEPEPDSNVSIDDMRRQQQQIIAGIPCDKSSLVIVSFVLSKGEAHN